MQEQVNYDVSSPLFGEHIIVSDEEFLQITLAVNDIIGRTLHTTPDIRYRFIVGALLIEEEINRILGVLMPDFGGCCKEKEGVIDFNLSISLLRSFKILPDSLFGALGWIRKTRNDFAHDLEKNFDPDKLKPIINSFNDHFANMTKGNWTGKDLTHQAYTSFIVTVLFVLKYFHLSCQKLVKFQRDSAQIAVFAESLLDKHAQDENSQ